MSYVFWTIVSLILGLIMFYFFAPERDIDDYSNVAVFVLWLCVIIILSAFLFIWWIIQLFI